MDDYQTDETAASAMPGVADPFVEFTDAFADELLHLRALLESRNVRRARDEPAAEVARRVYPTFAAWLDERLFRLAELAPPPLSKQHRVLGSYFREKLWPVTMLAPFLMPAGRRVHGQPGFEGETVLGCVLHHHAASSAPARALRGRADLVTHLHRGKRGRLLVIGHEVSGEGIVAMSPSEVNLNGGTARLGVFENIVAFGLLDDLTRRASARAVQRLVDALRPGGALVVAAFDADASSRTYLDLWMDWTLSYRSRPELLDVAAAAERVEKKIESDPTGSQLLLVIRKP